jgi:hypothetical protein
LFVFTTAIDKHYLLGTIILKLTGGMAIFYIEQFAVSLALMLAGFTRIHLDLTEEFLFIFMFFFLLFFFLILLFNLLGLGMDVRSFIWLHALRIPRAIGLNSMNNSNWLYTRQLFTI